VRARCRVAVKVNRPIGRRLTCGKALVPIGVEGVGYPNRPFVIRHLTVWAEVLSLSKNEALSCSFLIPVSQISKAFDSLSTNGFYRI
jgi:hypothetical protein